MGDYIPVWVCTIFVGTIVGGHNLVVTTVVVSAFLHFCNTAYKFDQFVDCRLLIAADSN